MISGFLALSFKRWLAAAGPVGTSLSYREVPIRARFGHDERGSVAIEFAFIAVVFLTILFGIMSYGFQFATRIALSHAVSEGGRAAVAGLDDGQREQFARDAIQRAVESYSPLVNWSGIEVLDPQWRDTANGRVGDITITYTDNRFSFLPFIPTPDEVMRVSTTYIVTDPDG
jgi:Flp pilus assembly protein TadG